MSEKQMKVRGMKNPDCERRVSMAIKGATGLEEVHINMSTGEITYGPSACVDPQIIKEAVERAGYTFEEE